MEKVIHIPETFQEKYQKNQQSHFIFIPDHYEKRKVKDLIPRDSHVMYYYEYPDGTRIYRRGGYLIKELNSGRLLFASYPSSGLHIYNQKEYGIPAKSYHKMWSVPIIPKHPISGIEGKTVFFQARKCEELYKKYKCMKQKVRELMQKKHAK